MTSEQRAMQAANAAPSDFELLGALEQYDIPWFYTPDSESETTQ